MNSDALGANVQDGDPTVSQTSSAAKTCRRCGKEKPLAEFGRHKRTRDGLHRHCLSCIREAIAAGRRRKAKALDTERDALYAVLDALLPFAQVEVDFVADMAQAHPDDPDSAEDAERAQRGKEALDAARRLTANKCDDRPQSSENQHSPDDSTPPSLQDGAKAE